MTLYNVMKLTWSGSYTFQAYKDAIANSTSVVELESCYKEHATLILNPSTIHHSTRLGWNYDMQALIKQRIADLILLGH